MVWAGTGGNALAVGTQLVVDFGGMGITNNGVNAYGGLTLTTSHKIDDWLRLEPGNNSVIVTKTGGSTSTELAVVYFDGWV
jgi:hypothetical protein